MELDAKLIADLSRFLPADLLKQLPERHATRTAIQRLASLYTSVSSFLPLYIVENEERLRRDSGELRPGTFMFADVSGFTALSELLQAKGGSEGVEILTQIINDYFARMLEIIAKSDGQLLKFAGDALLAFFPERKNEKMDEAEKAIRTGLRMQRSMQEFFQPIQNEQLVELFGNHDLELKMSIGISRGKLFEALVGNTSQRDHIIQGKLPGMAEEAEAAGVRDDVIIDAPLYEQFKDQFRMKEVVDGFYLVIDDLGDDLGDFEFHVPRRRRASSGSLFSLVETDPIEELSEELAKVQTVACFVASEVINKLAITAEHVVSENRPATVIFSHVSGFAEMLETWGEDEIDRVVSVLSRYYTIVQRIVSSYGGVLTRTDPYKSGFKMLITFGAPIAHPDDPERAVTTAQDILRELKNFNERLLEELPPHLHIKPFIEQRFGITHGVAFAGEAGWRARREYTVMGDDVNLAARLMGAAPFGSILISSRVWKRVMGVFEVETLEPMALKGKSYVIQAYRVVKSKISTTEIPLTSDTPFIGRDLLMMSLMGMLKRAKNDNIRGVVTLYADAGTGKTRTAQELAQAAEDIGFTVAWSSCQLHNDRRTTWASLIAQLLKLDTEEDSEILRMRFDDVIEKLDLGQLKAGLSDLLSDYLNLIGSNTKRATKELEKAAEKPAKRSIFDFATPIAEAKDDMPQSSAPTGLFKTLSDHITPTEIKIHPSTAIWDGAARRTSLDEAVIGFLQAYTTKNNPVMLVIDDVHAMDPYTMEVVEHVMKRIIEAPLVIVGTTETNTHLPDDMPNMVISDLTQEETFVMATKILKANELGPNLLKFLWDRTSGRPFYVESVIHTLRMNHHVVVQQGYAELRNDIDLQQLPDDIRELILSRVDRLSAEKQEILRLGSVLDTNFTKEMLITLGEREDEQNLSKDLHDLVTSQMIERYNDGSYGFRHGVTKRTMYEKLSRYERQKLHRVIAEYWLSQEADQDRNLLMIAHHLVKAGSIMRAMEIIQMAATKAEENKDIERALELYARAQELLPNDESIKQNLERLREVNAKPIE